MPPTTVWIVLATDTGSCVAMRDTFEDAATAGASWSHHNGRHHFVRQYELVSDYENPRPTAADRAFAYCPYCGEKLPD
jgi:hypothetical protein